MSRATIRNKRRPKRIKLFRQGELGRLILGALRQAEGPLSTAAIVSAVIAAGGHSEDRPEGDGAPGAGQSVVSDAAGDGGQDER